MSPDRCHESPQEEHQGVGGQWSALFQVREASGWK